MALKRSLTGGGGHRGTREIVLRTGRGSRRHALSARGILPTVANFVPKSNFFPIRQRSLDCRSEDQDVVVCSVSSSEAVVRVRRMVRASLHWRGRWVNQ